MMNETMIGVDLAKAVFQVHGASMTGEPMFRKKLSRQSFSEFMAKQPPALVVMEACGSAHHWAREMIRLGHEVKLIAALCEAVRKATEERCGRCGGDRDRGPAA
ncbi:transposase [Sphingomonas faeni]|nr:transposase [Sphingomonas faeni]